MKRTDSESEAMLWSPRTRPPTRASAHCAGNQHGNLSIAVTREGAFAILQYALQNPYPRVRIIEGARNGVRKWRHPSANLPLLPRPFTIYCIHVSVASRRREKQVGCHQG